MEIGMPPILRLRFDNDSDNVGESEEILIRVPSNNLFTDAMLMFPVNVWHG